MSPKPPETPKLPKLGVPETMQDANNHALNRRVEISVFPPLPPDVAALSYASSFQWKTSTGDDLYRRENPIYTRPRYLPPSKVHGCSISRSMVVKVS